MTEKMVSDPVQAALNAEKEFRKRLLTSDEALRILKRRTGFTDKDLPKVLGYLKKIGRRRFLVSQQRRRR